MCGIAAIFSNDKNLENQVSKVIKKISHRGPDDSGFYKNNNLSLGSCRLSIFDFSANAKMPMTDSSSRYVVVYNGEIYNFPEIKKRFNIRTKTNTDTEILLEMYVKKGAECVQYFNGIFSFVIYDNINETIFCCRDRLGIKPLYYFWDNKALIVCSEIKGIHEIISKSINYDKLKTYLKTSFYDFSEQTFYKDIKQLQPAHYFKFDLKKKTQLIKKYWELNDEAILEISPDKAIDKLDDLIKTAFNLQVRTDTKLGVNLSSGLDSQLMLSVLNNINGGQKNIQANSYFFDDKKFSEKDDLQNFSKSMNWDVQFHKITSDDVVNNFDEVFNSQDGPFPGVPTIAKTLLIKKAYDKDCKVILEAQGGDDIAAGYRYVFANHLNDLIKNKEFRLLINEFLKFKKIENFNFIEMTNFIKNSLKGFSSGGISADGSKNIFENIFQHNLFSNYKNLYTEIFSSLDNIDSSLRKILYRDIFYCKLPRILKSCDRASMSNGKELRVPLLDHNILNFFYNSQNNLKIRNGNLRYIYRKYLNIKFNNLNSFKIKKYVSDPQTSWLKNDLYDWAYQKLADSKEIYSEIYKKNELLTYLKKFREDTKLQNSNLIWQALCVCNLLKN